MARLRRPLVGRNEVLDRFGTALVRTSNGEGACFVVEGPAGIGKSGVLDAVVREARASGLGVFAGRAVELDRRTPLATLRATLGSLLTHDRTVGDPLRMVDRVGDLVEREAARRPLALVVDDVQWIDELSALALRVLVPTMASAPVLWVLGRRPTPARGYAQDTVEWLVEEGAHRVALEPLAPDAVAALCEDILGAPANHTVLKLAARCNGNPFLLDMLLTTLRDTGQLVVDGENTRVLGHQLDGGLLTAVAHRFDDLSNDARRVLDAGAVLGRPFSVHEVAALVERSTLSLLPAVTEAIDADLLVDDGRMLSFRHDLMREVLYHRLSGPVRLALHREAVQMLRAERGPNGEVLEHLLRSDSRTDIETIDIVRRSVREMAPDTEADLILRMLELYDRGDPHRAHLMSESVWLLTLAGRVTEAIDLGEHALAEGLTPEAEIALLLRLAIALEITGYTARTDRYALRALAHTDAPAAVRASLFAAHAHIRLGLGDPDAAIDSATRALAFGGRVGDRAAVAAATSARSAAIRSRGDLAAAFVQATEAAGIAELTEGPFVYLPRLLLATAHAARDDFPATEAELANAQTFADSRGAWWSRPLLHRERAELRCAEGRLDAAAAEAETGVLAAEQLNAAPLSVPLLALLARVAVRRDDLTLARAYLRRGEELCASGVHPLPEDLPWAAATLDAAVGQPVAGLSRLRPLLAQLPGRTQLFSREPGAGPLMVRMATAGGRAPDGVDVDSAEAAELVTTSVRSLARRNPESTTLAAAAVHSRGLHRRDAGALREAVDRYRASPRPLELADALVDLGNAEGAAGRHEPAAEALTDAVRRYGECGAKRCADRAQRNLRELGGRRRSKGGSPGASGNGGWSSLTQSELRVVRLVAQGLTNREVATQLYLSPHTVDSHLRHSFVKLGITSRVELTRLALMHDVGLGD